jgi:hypothetical protein
MITSPLAVLHKLLHLHRWCQFFYRRASHDFLHLLFIERSICFEMSSSSTMLGMNNNSNFGTQRCKMSKLYSIAPEPTMIIDLGCVGSHCLTVTL